ncbi:hypothetical protein GH733_004035 [Mirounga leonina]|nr:hypothetical protein GH733_004035 [Mirounga leonina]
MQQQPLQLPVIKDASMAIKGMQIRKATKYLKDVTLQKPCVPFRCYNGRVALTFDNFYEITYAFPTLPDEVTLNGILFSASFAVDSASIGSPNIDGM